jgi:hypothetical protein
MKPLLWLVMLLAFCTLAAADVSEPVKFHVQLIYATNSEKPPPKGWKKVGPKLRRQLSPVFQWKEFWQVSRTEVAVPEGKGTKTRLTESRELEVQFQSDGRLQLMMYRDGRLVRKMKNISATERVIMGGDRTNDDAWFAVVRRDKPSTD